jgi:hypothetical protein
VRDPLTATGTASRIDGALTLKPGVTLTNGVGAALGGTGVVTGSVVFASGRCTVATRHSAAARCG